MMIAGNSRAVVKVDTVLLSGALSCSVALTIAALVSVPEVVGMQTIVMVALAPTARLPSAQVTVPPELAQLPPLLTAETKVVLGGNTLFKVTPLAPEGPRLVKRM